ncbi:unnamed protein product [Parnassius mnemosyne]|uniref:Pro-resilin n=1 Tax=Parnassius mnemosyne TaxID=213953 RepID=A0AAV1LIV0_9NEOP
MHNITVIIDNHRKRLTNSIFGLVFLTASVYCEPPVQGYNYHTPSGFGPSNSYLPPRTDYSNPSNSYLPPSTHRSISGPDYNGHEHGHGVDNEVPKSYEFGYSVKDSQSGNDYDRKETSDGHEVRGEYRVHLPDGRTQIVTYHADWQTGFHADVRYEGEARYPEPVNNYHQGYNYNAPAGFSGSLTGFHGNSINKPSTNYGPPGYH